MTARHRVMELLRLPAAEPDPPPPAPLFSSHYRPQPFGFQEPHGLPIALIPIERTDPLVIELPSAESLTVQEDLAALAKAVAERTEEGAGEDIPPAGSKMLALRGAFAWQVPPAPQAKPVQSLEPEAFPRQSAKPLRKRAGVTPVKIRRAERVPFFRLDAVSAGARILKSQPLPASSAGICLRPNRIETGLAYEAELRFDRIFSIEPFRRSLASPILPSGQHEALTRSGQHRLGPVRWEFLHELPEDAQRSRPERKAPAAQVNLNIHRESVTPWLVPMRPIQPEFQGSLRPFDWAQLIARLADFEDPAAAAAKTSSHATTTRMAAMARRKQERLRAIPVLGPVIHFWQTQGWASRALALAIPVLGFIAIKPSLDGSLREPVVLAKEMPRPVSTVVRREPTKELIASRGGVADTPGVATEGGAVPAAPPGVPMPTAPTQPPSAVPVATPETTADAKPSAPQKPTQHPKLVPERGNKATGNLPVANVEPKLDKFDQILLSRAAVELADDFSFGLDSWEARSNAVQWTYDATGFVRPHGLALYRPSLNLTDYSMEFLAKIDNSAISWVVRAQDLNNYMVVKMVQRGGGPLPRYTIMHYPVINGREGTRIEHPLPLNLYKDTLFRIRMDIRGSNYAVLVQDSVVDSWSDDRLPIGGVGFFTGLGEEARIRWVQVTYQNDFIGKLCAWLAPKPHVQ